MRQADSAHPYGYLTEKYAWALVSGVGVFFLGGGVTLYHGISGLLSGGEPLGDLNTAYYALAGCLAFESGMSYFPTSSLLYF